MTSPNPVWGALDFYVLGPLAVALGAKLGSKDFALRDKCVWLFAVVVGCVIMMGSTNMQTAT